MHFYLTMLQFFNKKMTLLFEIHKMQKLIFRKKDMYTHNI